MATEGRELGLADSCRLVSTALASLSVEFEVFRRALYRQHSQHRATLYFQPLRQIKRHLELLTSVDVSGQLSQLQKLTEDDDRRSLSAVKKTQISPSTTSNEAFKRIFQRLLGASHLMRKTNDFVCKAASFMGSLLSQSFFMPLALTLLASLARFHTLLVQMMRYVENARTSAIARVQNKTLSSGLPLSIVSFDQEPSQMKGREKEKGEEEKIVEWNVTELDTRKSEEMAASVNNKESTKLATELSSAQSLQSGFEKTVGFEMNVGLEEKVGLGEKVDFQEKVGLKEKTGLEETVDTEKKIGLEETVDVEKKTGLEEKVDFEKSIDLEENVGFDLLRSSEEKGVDSGVKRKRLSFENPSSGQLSEPLSSSGRESRGKKTPSRQKQKTPTRPMAIDDIFQQLFQ